MRKKGDLIGDGKEVSEKFTRDGKEMKGYLTRDGRKIERKGGNVSPKPYVHRTSC